MFRGTFSIQPRAAIVATALVTFTTACAGEKGGGGSALAVEVVSTAEASPLPVTTTVSTVMPRVDTVVSPDVTYAEAEAAWNSRRYGDAFAMFKVIVDQHPDNAWTRYMLALSAWKSGDRVSAEGAFRQVIAQDPKHLKSHLNLARVLIEEGRTREALDHAEKVVQLDSASTEGYRLLGSIHTDLNGVELARLAYEKAISLNPKDAWSMNNLAFLLIQGGRPEDALGPLSLATQLEPRNAVLQNNLGTALELTGRFGQATAAYKSALIFQSGHEKASAGLARINGRSDDPTVPVIDLNVVAESYAASIKR
jgi:Flp pilus assembly protein TadD